MKHVAHIVDQQIRQWEIARTGDHKFPETPKGPVICISRDLGVGARAIARRLGEELACTILGRDMIDYVAEDLHVQRRMVDTLDEHGRESMQRWVDGYLHGSPIEYDEYATSLVKVVRTAAMQGDVILLGRGAAFILGLKEAFCVRLVAPMERRVRHVMEYESCSRERAMDLIHQSDQERAKFTYRVFHRDLNDPLAYHLTLNLSNLETELAVRILVETMRGMGFLMDRTVRAYR